MCVTLLQALTCKIDVPLFPLKENLFTLVFPPFSFLFSTLRIPANFFFLLFVPKAKSCYFPVVQRENGLLKRRNKNKSQYTNYRRGTEGEEEENEDIRSKGRRKRRREIPGVNGNIKGMEHINEK